MSKPVPVIRETRKRGNVVIHSRHYSPPEISQEQRRTMQKHMPWMCVFFDDGYPVFFVAFGGFEGVMAVISDQLGPLVFSGEEHSDE